MSKQIKMDDSIFEKYTDEQIADIVIDWRSKKEIELDEQMKAVISLMSVTSYSLYDSTRDEIIETVKLLRDFLHNNEVEMEIR